MVVSKSTKTKTKKETIVGHVSKLLAKILYPLVKEWKILSLIAKIDGDKQRAAEGIWDPGGGIELLCTYFTLYVLQKYIKILSVR